MTMNDLFEQARSLQANGRWAEAESAYRSLIEREPGHFKAWNNLGVVLEAAGRAAEAVDAYEQAIRIDDALAMLHYNRGHALHESGRLDDAITAYRRALELDEDDGDTHANLAMALHQSRRAEEAIPHYQRALVTFGTDALLACRIGECLYVTGRVKPAREAYARAVGADPDSSEGFTGLARCDEVLREFASAMNWYWRATKLDPQNTGAYEGAIRCAYRLDRREEVERGFAEWERAQPGHAVAAHMRAAMLGDSAPERASADYVSNVFDGFAITFDETLERLDYRAPQMVAEALAARRPDGGLEILDLGCGTGLCAPHVKPLAARLAGLDLSAGMLARAKERGGYDELVQADIPPFLAVHAGAYDALIAADTLCYFGDLGEVAQSACGALRPGGLFVFTVERADDDETQHAGFILRDHGRYAHSEPYVRKVMSEAGFTVEALCDVVLRKEGGIAQHGWLVTAACPER